jgi:hypothetical protein
MSASRPPSGARWRVSCVVLLADLRQTREDGLRGGTNRNREQRRADRLPGEIRHAPRRNVQPFSVPGSSVQLPRRSPDRWGGGEQHPDRWRARGPVQPPGADPAPRRRSPGLSLARLDHLSPRGRTTLAALANSRWLLFVVPTVAPVVYVALATNVWAEYPFSLLFVADCVIALGLLAAIWATAREQVAWRQQHSRLTATAPPIAAATPEMDADGA